MVEAQVDGPGPVDALIHAGSSLNSDGQIASEDRVVCGFPKGRRRAPFPQCK